MELLIAGICFAVFFICAVAGRCIGTALMKGEEDD